MDYQDWIRKYSVGDHLLDSYHYIFFEAVEQIEKISTTGEMHAAQERLAFLLMYCNMHFEAEEDAMFRAGYPELEQHRTIHQAFRQRLMDLHRELEENPTPEATLRTAAEAREWWMQHILQEDMKYAPYLNTKE